MTKTTPAAGVSDSDRFVEIVEAGMRDGLQIEAKLLTTEQKLELINDVIESGIRHLEVTAFVSPRAVPQMADAEALLAGIHRRPNTNLMALIPNLRAAARAATTGLTGGVLMSSASNTHNSKNLNRTIDETISGFPAIADVLRDAGIEVLGGIATAFGCPFEGEVSHEAILKIVRGLMDVGVRQLTLGDTTGMATPMNIRSLVRRLRKEFPDLGITLHLHNTRGIGLANVLVGLEEGVRRYDATTGGLGGCPFAPGATGNICTEDLVYLLQEAGYETGVDLNRSIAVARKMEGFLDKPLVGQVMKAGPRLRQYDPSSARVAVG